MRSKFSASNWTWLLKQFKASNFVKVTKSMEMRLASYFEKITKKYDIGPSIIYFVKVAKKYGSMGAEICSDVERFKKRAEQ